MYPSSSFVVPGTWYGASIGPVVPVPHYVKLECIFWCVKRALRDTKGGIPVL
jgi:hypothetical protein